MLRTLTFLWLASTLCGAVAGPAADPLDFWHWRNPVPQGNRLNRLAFGDGTFVAVGAAGTIVTSRDQANWFLRDACTSETLLGVSYGNNVFVAVGGGTILVSPNGRGWTRSYSSSEAALNGVAYGMGLFVAAGGARSNDSSAILLTSPDGENWTLHAVGDGTLTGITFGDGRFVVVGHSAGCQTVIVTSTDGVNWSRQSVLLDSIRCPVLTDIVFGSGLYVAVVEFGSVISSNGVDWTLHEGAAFEAITYGNGLFVGVGPLQCTRFGCFYGAVRTSTDGKTWTLHVIGDTPLSGVTHANDTFVTVSYRGEIFTSQDATRWERRSPEAVMPGALRAISYGDGKFVAVGWNNLDWTRMGIIMTSPDGAIWTPAKNSFNGSLTDITYDGGQFATVGSDGRIHASTNGSDWTLLFSGITTDLSGIAQGNGRLVAIGAKYQATGNREGRALTSSDGTMRSDVSLGTNWPVDVAFGDGLFVTVCENGALLSSSDGASWTQHQLDLGSAARVNLHRVSHLDGRFIALGSEGVSFGYQYGVAYLFSSEDGTTWATATLPWHLVSLSCHSGVFVGLGYGGLIVTSTDLATWRVRIPANFVPFATWVELSDVAYGNGTFVAVGPEAIRQSDPLTDSPPSLAQGPLGQSVAIGTTASFKVTALGSSPLSCQWLKDDMPLPGATDPLLTLSGVTEDDEGVYLVVVTNKHGAAISSFAVLQLSPHLSLRWNGIAELRLTGPTGRLYRVDYVDELRSSNEWQEHRTFHLPASPFSWTDSQSATSPQRLYRAIRLP